MRKLVNSTALGVLLLALGVAPVLAADRPLPVGVQPHRPAVVWVEMQPDEIWEGPAVYRVWTHKGPKIVAVPGLGYRYYRGWCFDHVDECASSVWP